uniref:Uncharacterized protein ycf20 n=1 Tax=Sphondylothamnion multifidum TaxID=193186 RepID=A0A4D6X008_9FLOR|nr:hypothetical protein [Sphondylothamnion multifidum]
MISLMSGFFISSILSTITTHTGDWGMMSASIIITFNEILSKFIYQYKKNINLHITFHLMNDIKIGIIYGLFVDAFKLGS